MEILYGLVIFLFIEQGMSQFVPVDCRVDNCNSTLERINSNNTESYCSNLITAWVCLERILGKCSNIFEGYARPEVNSMMNQMKSKVEASCDYNQGCVFRPDIPIYIAMTGFLVIMFYIMKY